MGLFPQTCLLQDKGINTIVLLLRFFSSWKSALTSSSVSTLDETGVRFHFFGLRFFFFSFFIFLEKNKTNELVATFHSGLNHPSRREVAIAAAKEPVAYP